MLASFTDMIPSDEGFVGHRAKRVPVSERTEKPWRGKFIAVDGEGWDGKYTLLQMTDRPDMYNPDGLPTKAILRYLTDHYISSQNAFVGYGLNYDFEMWLKDLSDDEFMSLVNGEEIEYEGYRLTYIPRKMFTITHTMRSGKERTITIQDVLGFFQASFEDALEKWKIEIPPIITEFKKLRSAFHPGMLERIKVYNRAELEKLCELMEALRSADRDAWAAIGLRSNHSPRCWYGPGSRASNFLKQTNWEKEHPTLKLPGYTPDWARKRLMPSAKVHELAVILANEQATLESIRGGIYQQVLAHGGIKPPVFYSKEWKESIPAALRRRLTRKNGQALDVLADELGMTARELIDALSNLHDEQSFEPADYYGEAKNVLVNMADDMTYEHMFASAYYGGRIEAAGQGRLYGRLYDYDINSAYPYAITHLPKWNADSLVWVEGLDSLHRIGMYYVKWWFAEDCNFYPLPFRSKSGNVYFPRSGQGWYMSPEVEAIVENWPKGELYDVEGDGFKRPGFVVCGGFVLDDTDGAGNGIKYCGPDRLCSTASFMARMASVRMEAKAKKLTFEKALKLLMNSCYGKTIQQVGTHKYLQTFAAAWITSTCRALILQAIGMDTKKNVVSIMTDGILTKRPLPVKEGAELGEFECSTFDGAIQLVPGVYRLDTDKRGKRHVVRYRGVGKRFSYLRSLHTLRMGDIYRVKLRLFVSRTLAIHQPNAYGDQLYKFVDMERSEDFSLKSKREGHARLTNKHEFAFLPPKGHGGAQGMLPMSEPYALDIEPVEIAHDMTTNMEDMLSRGLSTLLLDEQL